MNLSTEKTPHQKLSNFSVDNVSAVNITHLATDNLNKVAIACDELNQQAGSNKAIPHVAARNIKGEKELEVFLKFCKSKEINKVLVIGGSIPRNNSNIFQTDQEIANILKKSGITVDC